MSSSLEHKLDLLLSLVHDHGARLRRLEEKIEPGVAKFSKYVSCSQLGQMVGCKVVPSLNTSIGVNFPKRF